MNTEFWRQYYQVLHQVLDLAADMLERDGWHQGSLYDKGSPNYNWDRGAQHGVPMCTQGAIVNAWVVLERQGVIGVSSPHGRQLHSVDISRFLSGYLEREEIYLGHNIPHWNDACVKDPQEVLDALRGASKDALRRAEELVDA